MANTFITPTVIARTGLAVLYNTLVLAQLVWRDFDSDFAGKQGNTVNIRTPASFEAEEFNREAGVTTQEVNETETALALDTIANVTVAVTDEEMTLDIEDFSAQILVPAMEAIAQKVDGDLAELLVDTAQAAGAKAELGGEKANFVFREARKTLGRSKLPTLNRSSVVSPESSAEVLGDELIVAVDKSGSTDALREAVLGRLFGFDTFESQVLGAEDGVGNRAIVDGLAFHRSAVVLASRPLVRPKGVAENQVAVENYKSLSLRTVYDYNHNKKQDEVSVDFLYGKKATREEGVVELDFGQGS